MQDYYPFNPLPEGVELQRMKPETERLVIQAEQIGKLRAVEKDFRKLEVAYEKQKGYLDASERSEAYYKGLYEASQDRAMRYEKKLKRLQPKKKSNGVEK